MRQGLIHIYCGDGKGKTTAAIGLAMRAHGAGLKVLFAQFMKRGNSSEWHVLDQLAGFESMKIRNSYGFTWKMTEEEKRALTQQNTMALQSILHQSDQYDLIVLDEILSAYQYNLVDRSTLVTLITQENRPEIVLTGRNPENELIALADYITEMKCEKHPYQQGIEARKGIEF